MLLLHLFPEQCFKYGHFVTDMARMDVFLHFVIVTSIYIWKDIYLKYNNFKQN